MSSSFGDIFSKAMSVASDPGKSVGEAYGDSSSSTTDESSIVSSSSENQNSGLIDSILGKETAAEEGSGEQSAQDAGQPSKEQPEEGESTPKEGEVEYITVKGPNGRSQQVKVDYNDRDHIKKVYSMAAGMRKFQAERDNLARELETLRGSAGKKAEQFDQLNQIYKESGIEGLIDVLAAEEGGFQKLLEKKIEEREWRQNATPEELALHQAEMAKLSRDKEYERLRKEFEDMKLAQQKTIEQAETKALESQVHPVFDKYRFAGKLGNAQDEHMLDKMLWNTALQALEDYPDDADISPEIIQKEFSSAAQTIRRLVNKQVDKGVTRAVEQKKKTAMETAQAQAIKQYSGGQGNAELRKALERPNVNTVTQMLTGILKRNG